MSGEKDRALFESYVARTAAVPKEETAANTPHRRSTIGDAKHAYPKDTLDLHGMTSAHADKELLSFITKSYAASLSPVLVIHGKGLHSGGEGILKKLVTASLAHRLRPYIRATAKAPARLGGGGATVVWLQKK